MEPPPHAECLIAGRYYVCSVTDCKHYLDRGNVRDSLCERFINQYAAECGGLLQPEIGRLLGLSATSICNYEKRAIQKLKERVKQ